jgi:hypothetical protein
MASTSTPSTSSLIRYFPCAEILPSSSKLSSAITGTSSPPLPAPPAMLNASCLVPDSRAVPRAAPIAHLITSKRLRLISALFLSLAKFCDDGSIAIALCDP